jgi:hypothetical protein
VGHRLGDAAHRLVGVGVGREEGAAAADQRLDGAPLRRRRGDAVDAGEEERVVGQQQVGVPGHGLAGDLEGRVDGEQHPAHLGVRVAGHQPDGVPGVGRVGRVPGVQQVDDVTQAWHGLQAS